MSDWINQRYWPGWKKIFRVEEFSEAASIVQSQLELPPISRKIDESPDSYRRKIIRESDGLIIAEMYAEDFEKFQYSFAIPEILAEDC